ncbi:hypothetical protein J6590_017736 [Homalodisca vitripennis]|nr:hypothetical protein J6590_017736 [Homalodisca vitripennis]
MSKSDLPTARTGLKPVPARGQPTPVPARGRETLVSRSVRRRRVWKPVPARCWETPSATFCHMAEGTEAGSCRRLGDP